MLKDNMGQKTDSLNNMEIVSRALNHVTTSMQNLIAATMQYRYGESWWNEKVVDNKSDFGIVREIEHVDYFDLEENRAVMDTQLCCKIMERYIDSFTTDRKMKSLVTCVRNVRNGGSHNGNGDYDAETANDCMDSLIEFVDGFDLCVDIDLNELKNMITEVAPKKSLFSDHAVDKDCGEPDPAEKTVSICNDIPSEKDYIGDVCVESTYGFLNAIENAQNNKRKTSRQTASARYVRKMSDNAIELKIDGKFIIDDTTGIDVDGKEYPRQKITFQNFNSVSGTVSVYLSKELEGCITENSRITLYNDMKWLIMKTGCFFEKFGDCISYPPKPEMFIAENMLLSSALKDLTPNQSDAVKMIMNQPLSYVWGVPGSGKTKYVLAKAINECVSRDKKVLVVAPTNYALEQVIEGLISAFNNDKNCKVDVNRDMIRVGAPTAGFLSKYPGLCEKKGVQSKIAQHKSILFHIRSSIADRKYAELKPEFDKTLSFSKNAGKNSVGAEKLVEMTKELRKAISKDPRYSYIAFGVSSSNIMKFLDNVNVIIYSKKDRTDKMEFDDLDMEGLEREEEKYQKELTAFQKEDPKGDISSCNIIAMTMSKFIISYGPSYVDKYTEVNVDHVFLDEAGYCNCIQTMALFTLGAPVTMLGDHMQLPPVCEIDRNALIDSISDKEHRFDYLWDTSALYADTLFDDDPNLSSELYRNNSEPTFRYTSVARLTTTHRFGQNLATILGETVYNLPLKSNNKDAVELVVIDAHIDSFPTDNGKVVRKNREEAVKAIAYAEALPKEESYIILTPYRDQIRCLESNLRSIDRNNITTIHKSQGKEWDTVIISVCDGRACNEDKPPRFTSTVDPASNGLKVINTALSRAKKRLVIVCDVEYWSSKPEELLGRIVLAAKG